MPSTTRCACVLGHPPTPPLHLKTPTSLDQARGHHTQLDTWTSNLTLKPSITGRSCARTNPPLLLYPLPPHLNTPATPCQATHGKHISPCRFLLHDVCVCVYVEEVTLPPMPVHSPTSLPHPCLSAKRSDCQDQDQRVVREVVQGAVW